MKIIFLDIDGVLITGQSIIYNSRLPDSDIFWALCPIACSNLSYLLMKVKDLNIVITSTRRLQYSQEVISKVLAEKGIPSQRIIGSTPDLPSGTRSGEIQAWLDDQKNITHFVIVDDLRSMKPFDDKFIKTDPLVGLMLPQVIQILEGFGVKDIPVFAI